MKYKSKTDRLQFDMQESKIGFLFNNYQKKNKIDLINT